MKHAQDAAPALSRGLALLRLLDGDVLATLEDLARSAKLPKASALRLLRALQAAGLIAREPEGKRWRASARIVRIAEGDTVLLARHTADLDHLCAATGQVVELYVLVADGMRMLDRREPARAGIALRAQIGFLRDFVELEAVAQIGLAHRAVRVGRGHWCYRDGLKQPLTAQSAAAVVALARARGWASDLAANAYGVRRVAVPLLDGSGKLSGALAIAAVGPDIANQRLGRLRDLLISTARRSHSRE